MGWHSSRVIVPELLDHAPPPEAARSLGDIRRLNRWFGGHVILRGLLREAVDTAAPLRVLDVGAGSGDMGDVVRRLCPRAEVVSLDYRLTHLRENHGTRLNADAFALPFRSRSFDVVFCSLFLHHFGDDRVRTLLHSFGGVAREAVLAVDLVRHPFSWRFVPVTAPLLGWHRITQHDAPASVQASFTVDELLTLARAAGLEAPLVRAHHPWFRLSLSARPCL